MVVAAIAPNDPQAVSRVETRLAAKQKGMWEP